MDTIVNQQPIESETKTPAGTHSITSKELGLPIPVDMARALLNTELNYFCYRQENKLRTAPKNNSSDAERIKKISGLLGYQSFVVTTYNQQAVIYYNNSEAIVAFEGSWIFDGTHYTRNLNIGKVAAPPPFEGKLHAGFSGALDNPIINADDNTPKQSLYEAIHDKLKSLSKDHPDIQLHLTGHSAGGTLAAITAARLYSDLPELKCQSIYSFGQPRFSDRDFKDSFQDKLGQNMFRFENYGDPAPAWPIYDEKEWVHSGQWIPMDEHGRILEMDDDSVIEDTLSRSETETETEKKETLSKSTYILWNKNRAKHKLHPYADIVHHYLLNHPQEVDQRHLRACEKGLTLWGLAEIYDRIEDLVTLLPTGELRKELWDIRTELDKSLTSWEQLQKNPGEKLFSDSIDTRVRERSGWKWSKDVPDHRIHVHSLSRSKVLEHNLDSLEKSLSKYKDLLEKAITDKHPSSSHSLIESTTEMIDKAINSLYNIPKNAPDIYPRNDNALESLSSSSATCYRA